MITWQIPLSDVDLGKEEISAVEQVLQSRWLTMGAVTQEFESAFAKYTGAKYALAVTNCTAALHMACMAIGLTAGDEVILPSLSFVATGNCIRYTGATPVFADITGEQNLTISPSSIESRITDRTRAIIVMHYAGYSCDMPQIMDLARRYNLKVIEDAAHAAGSWLDEKHLGTWGDIGCFSFFSNKNMTTGEGGMVVTNNADLYEKLRLLRSHGMTSLTWDRHRGHASSYDVVALGYNYRIDEVRAAIGKVQLAKLDSNNKQRRQLIGQYRECLDGFPEITVPFSNHRGITAAHIMPILLPPDVERTCFMEQMKAHGIQTSIHYPPIHKFTAYRARIEHYDQLSVTEDIAGREVTLPLYPGMDFGHVRIVTEAVSNSLVRRANLV